MIIFYGEVAGIPLDWIVFGTIGKGAIGELVTVSGVQFGGSSVAN